MEVAAGPAPFKITASGYTVRRDTLTIANATPVTHNIAMGEKTAIINRVALKHSKLPQVLFTGENLIITNITDKGDLAIFSLNGTCIYKTVLNNASKSVILPDNIAAHGSSVIVQFKTRSGTVTHRALIIK
jgi:hypothetical protein